MVAVATGIGFTVTVGVLVITEVHPEAIFVANTLNVVVEVRVTAGKLNAELEFTVAPMNELSALFRN